MAHSARVPRSLYSTADIGDGPTANDTDIDMIIIVVGIFSLTIIVPTTITTSRFTVLQVCSLRLLLQFKRLLADSLLLIQNTEYHMNRARTSFIANNIIKETGNSSGVNGV